MTYGSSWNLACWEALFRWNFSWCVSRVQVDYEKHIKELNSVARLFEHERSGRAYALQNDDATKCSLCFRTPPTDVRGFRTALEHSAPCGSRKFPTKEPFVELARDRSIRF